MIGPYTFEQFKEKASRIHGFPAPGLLIGGCMVEAAKTAIPSGVRLAAIIETTKCLADAVQLLTSCSAGNGRIKIMDFGRFALSLFDSGNGEGARARIDPRKVKDFPEIEAWLMKTACKEDQDIESLWSEIERAGSDICDVSFVRVRSDFLVNVPSGGIAQCPCCKEMFPSRDGNFCRACKGESPYIRERTDLYDGVTGIVLAGGKSSRLGFDKGHIVPCETNDENLLTRTARLLGRLVPRVIIAGREHPEFESWRDDIPDAGPVGAIATALRRVGGPCLALACDMPFINENTLSNLLAGWEIRSPGTLLTTFASAETGQRETLASVYEPGALKYFEDCMAKNLLKLSKVVPEEYHHVIEYSREDATPFFTINCPADLAVARLIKKLRP
ncbi:MAG: FmdE family protein [Synergistaceae bacterium]|jgi:molybdopterin-guanine dinucleotide biosynthesis protein A/formylmethanofuran dehydrogenase subunit E|nr:FmdE family protein [Synergistaceae bacterium]